MGRMEYILEMVAVSPLGLFLSQTNINETDCTSKFFCIYACFTFRYVQPLTWRFTNSQRRSYQDSRSKRFATSQQKQKKTEAMEVMINFLRENAHPDRWTRALCISRLPDSLLTSRVPSICLLITSPIVLRLVDWKIGFAAQTGITHIQYMSECLTTGC